MQTCEHNAYGHEEWAAPPLTALIGSAREGCRSGTPGQYLSAYWSIYTQQNGRGGNKVTPWSNTDALMACHSEHNEHTQWIIAPVTLLTPVPRKKFTVFLRPEKDRQDLCRDTFLFISSWVNVYAESNHLTPKTRSEKTVSRPLSKCLAFQLFRFKMQENDVARSHYTKQSKPDSGIILHGFSYCRI